MEQRQLGRLGEVSALTLGGGGIGAVWGPTSRDEAVATVREAVASGVTLLDMAPSYGDGEAERVIGDAFEGVLPAGVRVTTKHRMGDVPSAEVYDRLVESLDGSLARMRLERVDVFVLHSAIVRDDEGDERGTPVSLFREAVRPAFERLVATGRVGAWGITGIGRPSVVRSVLPESPRPSVVQCIANLLDSTGALHRFDEPLSPRETIRIAAREAVGVMGIRAVQAGALTDAFDRDLPEGHRDRADYDRAAPFRALASELGSGAAHLAHRYALSIAGVDTVVLGVKNRDELRDCLAAEAAGPLDAGVIARIDAAVSRRE
jgi:aryl-alcohol dehydrogenase-like predicted oxidoreductase